LVSVSQAKKMIGNAWTVDVIAHIFSYLKWFYFELCEKVYYLCLIKQNNYDKHRKFYWI
jgi:hypothetical protein